MNGYTNHFMDIVDQRLFLLFCRETRPQLISDFWADPQAFDVSSKQESDPLRVDYEAWLATKRQITLKELLEGTWEIQDYYKRRYLVNFSPNNTFLERDIASHSLCFAGEWELGYQGVPCLKLGSTIELDIVANMEGDSYSAVQIVDGKPHDYLKITHHLKRLPIPLSIKAA